MSKNKNAEMIVGLFALVMIVVGVLSWGINAYKFVNCDFEANYKCEAIHATGVFIPPSSVLTVWFESDH